MELSAVGDGSHGSGTVSPQCRSDGGLEIQGALDVNCNANAVDEGCNTADEGRDVVEESHNDVEG